MGIDFAQIFQGVLQKFGDAIPGIVGALVVFLAGWMLASMASRLIKRLLGNLGIDKFAEQLNQVDLFAQLKWEIKPSAILSQIAYYLIIIISMMVAAEVSGLQELSDLMEKIVDYAPKALVGFIIMVFGLFLADFIKKLIITACASVGIPSGRIIAIFIFYFILLTVSITALEQMDIDTQMISTNLTIAILGIVLAFSVGYGIASRKVMASILSSFFYTKGKVEIGHNIRINEHKGVVEEMDSTSVTLRTEGGSRILIPLSRFAESDVEIFN